LHADFPPPPPRGAEKCFKNSGGGGGLCGNEGGDITSGKDLGHLGILICPDSAASVAILADVLPGTGLG